MADVIMQHRKEIGSQILSDVRMMGSYIDNRLRYGLKPKKEQQLLFGTNVNGELNGIANQASAHDTAMNFASDTGIDILGHALYQVELQSNYEASAIVLNP